MKTVPETSLRQAASDPLGTGTPSRRWIHMSVPQHPPRSQKVSSPSAGCPKPALGSLRRRRDGGAAEAAARIQARERDKEQRVREVRVEHIKLKHEIPNLETILKAQGELVDSQLFVDFEHMRKENQKHNKKIDDLGDEIQKLKKNVSNTVHIFSQFREKLQFVEAENQGRKAELMDIETVLSQEGDNLTKTKQARDRLRRNNLKLQQECGLIGNEILLRDFEEKVDTAELLSQQLETLEHHYARLILSCRGIQKKSRKPIPRKAS
ncbi:coiled-coil domain-containing protein 96 [Athene cunicularia]|uniref:coiled-coil domain-containing protein 96 n=1 Tax=Athene cunicularia TaxID=194338 RepID=UPI000EF6A561|nr:coiled-coil domain-containing protein 96 [Athene cunicularia]